MVSDGLPSSMMAGFSLALSSTAALHIDYPVDDESSPTLSLRECAII